MTVCTIVLAGLWMVDYATNSIAKRIGQSDPKVCLSRFVGYPPSKGRLGFPRCLFEKPFQQNEKFWFKDIDFTCVSPWNDRYGTTRAGTLISKRHVIFAKHYPLTVGTRIVFVDEDGGVCPCRIAATKGVGGRESDIMIGSLDYEVTPGIHPAKIIPSHYEKYLGNAAGLPTGSFNQREELLLNRSYPLPREAFSAESHSPLSERAKLFSKTLIGGDSGNPVFLLIGNQAILIYCIVSGGNGSGTAIHRKRIEIQQVMDELCPGYSLESADLSKIKPKP